MFNLEGGGLFLCKTCDIQGCYDYSLKKSVPTLSMEFDLHTSVPSSDSSSEAG